MARSTQSTRGGSIGSAVRSVIAALGPTAQPPVATAAPKITGTTSAIGNTLAAASGTYTGGGSIIAKRWLRNGVTIPGATADTYTTTAADLGQYVGFVETVDNGKGLTRGRASDVYIGTPAAAATPPSPIPGFVVLPAGSAGSGGTGGTGGSSGGSVDPNLPKVTIASNGALSIPAGTAPAGSDVVFTIEGIAVGTVKAASDGSATLASPTYLPGVGAAVSYGALKTAAPVSAPVTTLPPYSNYNNVLTQAQSNDISTWTVLGATAAKVDATTGLITLTGTGSNSYISLNPSLTPGVYTLGATIVRKSGSGSIKPVFFFPVFGQPSGTPTQTTDVPQRLSAQITVTASGQQSIALADNSGVAGTYQVYNIVLAKGSVDPFKASDPPQLCPQQSPSTDYAAQFLTTMNYPTQLPPAVAGSQPAGSLRVAAGAQNVVHMDFTPSGNVNTREQFDSMTFNTAITGNLTNPIGDGGTAPNYSAVDGAQATKTFGRYRRYPKGHIFDNQTFGADGLKLGVVGARNNQSPFVGPAVGTDCQVYAAGFRLETPFLPGMTVERIVKFGTNPLSWNCIWMFVGVQISPDRYAIAKNEPAVKGQPYAKGFNQPGALIQTAQHTVNGTTKGPYYEIDDHDAWWRKDLGDYMQGAPAGFVRQGTQSDSMVITPYTRFLPADNGFTFGVTADQYLAKFNTTLADGQFHSIIVNWIDEGNSRTTLQFICDGKLFMEQYLEYWMDTYVDPITGTTQKIGMHILTGGQSIPGFILDGYTDADAFKKIPVAISNPDSLALVVKSVKVWKGNIDQATLIKPTNGLTQKYSALTTTTTAGTTGSEVTVPLTGVQSSGTKLTAVSSDGTAVTVSGSTIKATFAASGAKWIDVTEHPYVTAASGVGLGIPRTTRINLTIADPAPLSNLVLATKSVNVGVPWSSLDSAQSPGSVLSAPSSSDASPLLIGGSSGSNTILGKFLTSGTKTISVTETLSGAAGSPKTSTDTLTVLADSPAGPNLVTDPVIGGATWGIGSAGGSPSLTIAQGQPDASGGTTGQSALPTTASGLHRFSKVFGGLTAGVPYETYVIVKRIGTGPGSRYLLIGNSDQWGKATFDLANLTAILDPTYKPSGGYLITDLGGGYYKLGVRGTPLNTSQSMFIELVNGYATDDTVAGVGTFAGDGTSGLLFAGTFFGKVS